MRRLIPMYVVLLLTLSLFSCEKIKSTWLVLKAETAYNQGNTKKAVELYKELIALNPTQPEFYWKLGIAHYSNNDKPSAQKQVARLKTLGRNDLADDLQQLLDRK